MKRLFAGFLAILVLGAPALAQTKPDKPLWAHLASDIAPDPAVKFAVLPNGMRYALMKFAWSGPPRCSSPSQLI